ncbi:putative cytokinetic ring protein SteA [Pseudonocardia endophytica]|uniref:Putative membrane-anchored protein n=1 Tax=Pseudonocardia endophytica TaxID=401976 RepID=A0A4R1HTM6_PSEEN|nr:putative cytokinetic ring protein SteA [Pseudonocardia endophytica]TCK24683.1 putative membrane-anchored protein [Pseudonocardia endophytica]
MRLPGLLHRSRPELPGVVGTARVDRRTDALLRRVRPGEIAVLDQIDLDRPTAEALVAADVAAVVNASPSISGRFPNLGPQILVEAGVPLVDDAGTDLLRSVKDGAEVRLHDGVLYSGEQPLGEGREQTDDTVADALAEAKSGLTHQLEAFAANTIEFMRRERSLLLDGNGVPEVEVDLAGRQVVIVGPGGETAALLKRLRTFIREYRPVLVGVGAGADTLVAAKYRPDLVLADPSEVSNEALTSGADVVVPAFADGHAPGLHRVQDLGASAVTFPSMANPEDLALLLAHHHGAQMIVTVGLSATMGEFLDRGRSGSNASTFLTRLQTGGSVVDGELIASMYRGRTMVGPILLLVLAAIVAVVVAVLVSGAGDDVLAWLGQAYRSVADLIRGWTQ